MGINQFSCKVNDMYSIYCTVGRVNLVQYATVLVN